MRSQERTARPPNHRRPIGAPELTHPARCGWRAASLGSGSHWARRALFLERYISAWQLSCSLARSLTHIHTHTHTSSKRNEEVESSLARREMRAAATSARSPRRVSALLGRQTHFASRCAVTHTCCAAGGPRADCHELRVSKEEVFFLVWCAKPSCRPINESAESANKSDFSVDGCQGIREERYSSSCDGADSLTCHSVITELS